jgi:ATP-dependent helicase HepA
MLLTAHDDYGVGKLVEVAGDRVRVEYFNSIVDRVEREYNRREVAHTYLTRRTRVYVRSTDGWRMGRLESVQGRVGGPAVYEVDFPNRQSAFVPEAEIYTRSLRAAADPSDSLAAGGIETQYLHDRRAAALGQILRLRAAARGITGLLSASIELVPHQVDIARRVLEDPIQRYLLADEVGLGKTIEAGVIIRQRLLDDSRTQVVVLAPQPLVRQWERELLSKFKIDQFGDRVTVLPFSAGTTLRAEACDLLVIDEVHHLVASNSVLPYERLAKLAQASRGLLLLSATPVIGHEDETLRMLHLLDPIAHRLEDRDTFRLKVERRQEFGHLLLALKPGASGLLLKLTLRKLLDALPDDSTVAELAAKLRDADPESAPPLVASLKRHIADTYRLHQRLLRTRRKDARGRWLQPRGGPVTVDVDEDERMAPAREALEDWRYVAVDALESGSTDSHEPGTTSLEAGLTDRYVTMFEALGRGVDELREEANHQLQRHRRTALAAFAQDAERLAAICRACDGDAGLTSRLATAQTAVSIAMHAAGDATKVVVFSSATAFARALAARLGTVCGAATVCAVLIGMPPDEIDAAVERFSDDPKTRVLVCDRSGEEGLNLHMAHGIVHLDLPLAPGRLEQRIGRLDRFGRQHDAINHRLLLPDDGPDSPWAAWYEVLREGFGIFDESVSEVQFLLEGIERELHGALFRQGAAGVRGLIETVRERMAQERERLDEQYALDRLDADTMDGGPSLFDDLRAADTDIVLFRDALGAWLGESLQFHAGPDPLVRGASQLHWTQRTLIPEQPWKELFEPALAVPLVFQRRTALRRPASVLVRPGSPLIEALERLLDWDDRGTAFATWRVVPSWRGAPERRWLGFRLCYAIEAGVSDALAALGTEVEPDLLPSVRRRADDLFPPWLQTLHFGTDLNEVRDPEVLAILGQSYVSKDDRRGPAQDYNLGSRQAALFEEIDRRTFNELCHTVRARSEELLRGSPSFIARVENASDRARRDLERRNDRLSRRDEALAREGGNRDPEIARELEVNKAVAAAAARPRVRLDALGFFVLAGAAPNKVLR